MGIRDQEMEVILQAVPFRRGGHRILAMIFRSSAGVFLGFAVHSFGKTAPVDSAAFSKSMAVLDLVDLKDNRTRPEASEALRRSLVARGGFHIMNRDTMMNKLSGFGSDARQSCNNAQCSFDAGGYLQVDFVLFGTYSKLGNTHAATLKLLRVSDARIVWTWAGDIAEKGVEEVEEQSPSLSLTETARRGRLTGRQPRNHRNLALLDLSENTYLPRIFSERLLTHVSGLPGYDLISPSELSDLLSALAINRYSMTPSAENMIGLGERLGTSCLIYARLYQEGGAYLCRLALYDIDNKSVVVEFPPQPTRDFARIMDEERAFFSALSSRKLKGTLALSGAAEADVKSHTALWISLGLLGVAVALTALWAENLNK